MSALLLSVVLPAYNEAAHLRATLAEIRRALINLNLAFEMVVVDDGSTDATWPLLQALSLQYPEFHCLRLSRNFGKEGAILAGLAHARGSGVVLMDCDLQHPPELLPQMVALWRDNGYDVVNAVKQRRGRESWFARYTARAFYRLLGGLTGLPLAGSADFKLLDRRVVEVYCRLPERNTFFRGLVPLLGFKQTEVPFTVASRAGGASKWPLLKRGLLAANAIVSFSALPLQIVTGAGLLFLLFAALLAAHTLYLKLSGAAVEGFATVILVVLLASSVLMLSLGIIGQYLAKIYDEVKQRPRYLVQAEIGINSATDRSRTRHAAPQDRIALAPNP